MNKTAGSSPERTDPVQPSRPKRISNLASRRAAIASLAIPVLLVGGVLFVMISLRDGVEAAVAGLAGWLPVGYAFAAGMVASVNPCGFLMLPTYIAYHLGTQEEGYYEQPAARRAGKALVLGLVTSAGFLVILSGVGVVIAAGGQWLVRVFPYAGVAIGGGMAALGIYLLVTHRTLGILAASRVTVSPHMFDFSNRVVLVAGASGNLGQAMAQALYAAGANLVLLDRAPIGCPSYFSSWPARPTTCCLARWTPPLPSRSRAR